MPEKPIDDKLDPNVITSAVMFWKTVYDAEEVTIKFIKKDKTIRIMRATLNFKNIPVKDHPKSVNLPRILKLIQQSKIMHVYDLDKKGWRSVPFETVEWLDTPVRRYTIKS